MLEIQPRKPRHVCSNDPWACLQGEESSQRSITACLIVERFSMGSIGNCRQAMLAEEACSAASACCMSRGPYRRGLEEGPIAAALPVSHLLAVDAED